MGNLDDLMGPKKRIVNKGGYPGPTLDDLFRAGFTGYNLSILYKRDGAGNVVEIYKKEPGKEYYAPMDLAAFELFKTEVATKLKLQLDKIRGEKEVSI